MSDSEPRITGPTLKVLGVFLTSSCLESSGADVARATKLASGTLYPILFRLERAKWLESRWEDVDPKLSGRPRRRFYSITALGAKNFRRTVKDFEPVFGRLVWV